MKKKIALPSRCFCSVIAANLLELVISQFAILKARSCTALRIDSCTWLWHVHCRVATSSQLSPTYYEVLGMYLFSAYVEHVF